MAAAPAVCASDFPTFFCTAVLDKCGKRPHRKHTGADTARRLRALPALRPQRIPVSFPDVASAAGVFLILALRELSWGRVFFPLGHTETGEPILMASADMPFHTEIHIAVGLAAALCLYGLARYTPWRQVFHGIALPWRHFVLLVLCMAFVTLGDHHAIFHTLQDQTIEELSELLLYLTLCHTAWYYRLHFEK